MGLFDKKFCDFCGNKIGLLGNKKLEDANMCKDCASKLSPWFSDRRHSTKADIEQQLQYREQNKSAVAAFSATQTLGKHTKLMIDENARKFMVTSASDIYSANPDVLDYSQAVACDLDVRESRTEIRRKDANGNSVSYNPPRYEYSYDFHVIIRVNHPYFDEMKFSISNGSIKVGEQPMNPGQSAGWSVQRSGFNPLGGNRINDYYECVDLGNQIKAAVDAMRMGGNVSMAIAGGMAVPGMQPGMGMQGGMPQQGFQPGFQQGMPQQGFQPGMQPGFQQGMPQQGFQQGMPQQGFQPGMGMQGGMPQQGYGPNGLAQHMQELQQAAMAAAQQQQGATGQYMQQGGYQQGMPQQGFGQNVQQGFQQVPQQGFRQGSMAMGMGAAAPGMAAAQGGMAPGMTVTCPVCQATTTLGAAGCCEFCGNKII